MKPRYLNLRPESIPPEIVSGPFRALLIADAAADDAWMQRIAAWIVARGCLYFVAWGVACEAWHDSVDWAVLETFNFGDIPNDRFVMTTWHDNEPLSEAMWFAGNCASHPDITLAETIILHIAAEPREPELLHAYSESQVMPDESGG